MSKPEFIINLEEDKRGLFQRVPLNLPSTRCDGSRLRPTSRNVLCKVRSFTRKVESKRTQEIVRLGSRFTYEQLKEEFGCSRASIAAALDELRNEQLIKKSTRDVKGTEYIYSGDPTSGAYYIVPQYLYTMYVCVAGEYRRLTTTAVHVLAYLMTQCEAPKRGGKKGYGGGICKTSYKHLAGELHFSINAIRKAINLLMKANLVFRPAESKGKNGKVKSGYRVSAKLYILRKYTKKANTPEEEKTQRENYYKDLREESERRANVFFARANKDSKFARAHKEYHDARTLELAKAEYYFPEMVPFIKDKIKKLKETVVGRLAKMGLSIADITVQRACLKCHDTGVLEGGKRCDCCPGDGGGGE